MSVAAAHAVVRPPKLRYRNGPRWSRLWTAAPELRREAELALRCRDDPQMLRELVDRRLTRLVEHACTSVPYYREAIDPRDFRGRTDLGRLPLLCRAQLQAQPVDFVADGSDARQCVRVHTSGSTGQPIKLVREAVAAQYLDVVVRRLVRDLGAYVSFFPGRVALIQIIDTDAPKSEWRPHLRMSRSMRFDLSSTAWDEPADPLAFLAAQSRFVLSGSPSTLLRLIAHAEQHDGEMRMRIRPGLIVSAGAPLLVAQRKRFEAFFGCRVADVYNCTEVGPVAVQCSHGSMHVDATSMIVECLQPDGSAAEDGEPGELVLTSLHNRVFPLIRYRIGDSGLLSSEPCGCRSAFPRLGLTISRGSTVFRRADGTSIVPAFLSYKLRAVPVLQYQVEQVDLHRFVFRYVADGEAHGKIAAAVRAVTAEVFAGATIDVEPAPQLAAATGKIRPFVSRLD